MTMIDVTFKIDKSEGAAASILLAPQGDRIFLQFDANNKAVATLNGKRDYPFDWELIGKNDDKLTVTWEAGGIDGTLIDSFKIDRNRPDTRPWPGGRWKAIGLSTLIRIEL